MKRYQRSITLAKALKGEKQTGRSFHVTFGYDKNRLVVVGINNYDKPHPWHKFGKYVPTKSSIGLYIPCLHSEIDALSKIENSDRITFINIRIDNLGKVSNSAPCKNCSRILQQIRYKNFHYSICETHYGTIIK